jgi:hypothetical protein
LNFRAVQIQRKKTIEKWIEGAIRAGSISGIAGV